MAKEPAQLELWGGAAKLARPRKSVRPKRAVRIVKVPRFKVPDLSPRDREGLGGLLPRFAFVAESPHVNEIAPEKEGDRRPLCGKAGRAWWKVLSEILEGTENDDVSLERLLAFCRKHRLAVMNAVQYPLDPKIVLANPEADPVKNLGFAKVTGEHSYKGRAQKDSPALRWHLDSLRERLDHPSLARAKIFCLGNDALWFVERALGSEAAERIAGKIPHPSAWWRGGGVLEKQAREQLRRLLG